jgi:hypothetical protein
MMKMKGEEVRDERLEEGDRLRLIYHSPVYIGFIIVLSI